MIIKVNKQQFLDDWELQYQRECRESYATLTGRTTLYEFETEDVNVETLLDYIKKGYGIKINCD